MLIFLLGNKYLREYFRYTLATQQFFPQKTSDLIVCVTTANEAIRLR